MGCWKWFNNSLREAGIKVTDENREKIDEVIHQYISEQAKYGRCSKDWRKARKEIKTNEKKRQELTEKLRSIA